MESPFAKYSGQTTVALYLEPMLNNYFQSYQNIITLSQMPKGPLENLVVHMQLPALSSFKQPSVFSNSNYCTFVLLRYPKINGTYTRCSDAFMTETDIPAIFSFLIDNGYTIDTSITTMLQKSKISIGEPDSGNKRKLICFIRS